jgi:tetratricopeptide (TPR) repeat protein
MMVAMIGEKLAHYQILAKIGSGGMGEVYRARDTKLDRDVALKVLPKAMARDPERRKRFEREAKAVAAFRDGLLIGYDHGEPLIGLAHVKVAQNDLAGAEKYARRSRIEGRRTVEALRCLGLVRAQQGAFDDALTTARYAVAADSTRASFELLAWVQVAGDIDIPAGIEAAEAAMAIPRKVMNLDKHLALPAPAEHALGLAYLKQGDPKKAVEYLEKAVAYQPKRESAKRDLESAREMASRHP